MKFCIGKNCPIQYDKIDPFNCKLTKDECIYRVEIDTEAEYWKGFYDGVNVAINILQKEKEKKV